MLTSTEVRALNQGAPEFGPGTSFAGNTNPDEIRRLIAESRARFLGPSGVAECRSQYERKHGAVELTESLVSISVF